MKCWGDQRYIYCHTKIYVNESPVLPVPQIPQRPSVPRNFAKFGDFVEWRGTLIYFGKPLIFFFYFRLHFELSRQPPLLLSPPPSTPPLFHLSYSLSASFVILFNSVWCYCLCETESVLIVLEFNWGIPSFLSWYLTAYWYTDNYSRTPRL